MRQVFLSQPWIHHEEPEDLKAIYYQYGKFEKIKKGTALYNGGQNGMLYFLMKGLGTFSFLSQYGKECIFALITPNRVLADIDGLSGKLVNVSDRIIRDSEVLSIHRDTFFKHIQNTPGLALKLAQSLIAKEESHMEAMIASFTLDVETRLKVFLKVLITSYQKIIQQGWNVIPLCLSNEEYASIVNASRVTISNHFSAWIKNGFMTKNRRIINVHSGLFEGIYDWL